MMLFCKKILLIFVVLLLSSCAINSVPPTVHYLPWAKREAQLSAIRNWQMYGALGIRYANQTSMAHFTWQQTAGHFAINIYTPINLGGVKITGDTHQVILWKSATEKIIAKTPEQLMNKELGWSLPLFDLRYWILGLPAPQIPYKAKFDSYNHLSYLEQQGWKINYFAFQSIKNIDLPTSILLTNLQLQVKLVIKQIVL